MALSPGSFIIGMVGIVVLFWVLARLSARMGEGMHLARYYYLYYLSILLVILTALLYLQSGDILALLYGLLIAANCLAILASYKYWWWLKDELVR